MRNELVKLLVEYLECSSAWQSEEAKAILADIRNKWVEGGIRAVNKEAE